MRIITRENRFKKEVKSLLRKHYDMAGLQTVLTFLQEGRPLPGRFRDHALSANWSGFRECHIAPNWLLIYKITENELILAATGTHDDLFK